MSTCMLSSVHKIASSWFSLPSPRACRVRSDPAQGRGRVWVQSPGPEPTGVQLGFREKPHLVSTWLCFFNV